MASLIPALAAMAALYYLIFYITADQIAIPESIAYNLIPAAKRVIAILLFAVPISIAVIMMLAYKITHKVVGPFDRILRELDECIEGKKEPPILVRKGDKFQPLADRINRLLDRVKK
jgi:hypothetical protein